MKEFIVTKLMFLSTTLITATTADGIPGIYCNNKAQTWLEAVIECNANGGILVSYNTGIGKPVANLSLNRDADIWTADYATHDFKEIYGQLDLCGFVYFDRTTRFIGDTFYGDCYAKRYYLCKNETTSTMDVFKSTYSGINISCNKQVNIAEIIRQNVKPGFYWTKGIQKVNILIVSEDGRLPPTYSEILCGAYTAKIGKYFINCHTRRHSLCLIPGKERGSLDKSCFSETLQTSTIKTTLKRSVKTTIEPSMSQTETVYRTTITSYSSVENSEYTPTVYRPTTVANQTKVDTHNKDNTGTPKDLAAEKHDSNLVLKVGVSVGACLALICGVILGICLLRRRNSTKRNSPVEASNETLKDETTLGKQNDYETLNHMYENVNTCSTNPYYTTLGDFEEKSPY